MVVKIFKMYFTRFLFFSILLYNIEAKAYTYWAEPVSKDDDTPTTTVKARAIIEPEPDVFNTTTTDKVDSAGWLTIENGFLTAHFPETVSSTTKRPYVDAFNVTTKKTDTIPWYSRPTKPAEYIPWYLKSNTTTNTTWDSNNTTSIVRGTEPAAEYSTPYYERTTAPFGNRPWPHRSTTRYPDWLPRTRKPHSHHYPWYPTPSPRRPTTPSWYTTTEKSSWDSNWYYNNTTWSSSGSTEFDYDSSLNSNRNDTNQTTGEANPDGSCKSCNPVNISINSKINQGADDETGTYGTFVSFLKKIVGKIIPSAINIAPNSNGTNVAVASGNGNMFFYVYN